MAFLHGQHPVKTIDCVAADTGISPATIAKWMERASVPGGLAILRLAAAYGPEFLIAVYPKAPAWLSDTVRTRRQERLTATIQALEAEREAL